MSIAKHALISLALILISGCTTLFQEQSPTIFSTIEDKAILAAMESDEYRQFFEETKPDSIFVSCNSIDYYAFTYQICNMTITQADLVTLPQEGDPKFLEMQKCFDSMTEEEEKRIFIENPKIQVQRTLYGNNYTIRRGPYSPGITDLSHMCMVVTGQDYCYVVFEAKYDSGSSVKNQKMRVELTIDGNQRVINSCQLS